MQWADFSGKNVALLGAGSENVAIIPHLLKAGATVTIRDKKISDDRREVIAAFPSAKLELAGNELNNLGQFDYVFRIAGMPVVKLEKALAGLAKKPTVTSAADLFLALAPGRTVGVTGTKGKGTTSTILGSILDTANKKTVVVGNIGKPMFEVYEALDEKSVTIVELSSFQLEDMNHSPEIAILLPITPDDHLHPLSGQNPNYHQSFNDYVAAKAHITLYQSAEDSLIYAADDDAASGVAQVAKAKKISVSMLSDQADYFVNASGVVFQRGHRVADLSELGLRGQHVWLDATMAIAAAEKLGATTDQIANGIRTFQPLPHRLEEFATKNQVLFVDDSYATNPGSAIAAIQAYQQPVIWIGGGSSKGATFTKLAEAIANSTVKNVFLLGQEAPKIAAALKDRAPQLSVESVDSLETATTAALKIAKAGDVVLLAPACASTDMFKNAAERGDKFQKLVNG